jgi:conjugal transfer/entry exclusion protein
LEETLPENETDSAVINLDGEELDCSNLSQNGIAALKHLQFVNEQILQKSNELQVADSARLVYSEYLRAEILGAVSQ